MNLLLPLAAGVGGGALGWVAHYLWVHRSSSPTTEGKERAPRAHPGAAPTGPPAPATAVPAGRSPAAGRSASAPAEPVTHGQSGSEEGLGLARRVILHLSGLGRLGHDEVARIGFTQQGMASALSARQGSLVRVLQRLEAANVLTVDQRHVSGVARRLKVYRLTALGESVARDLRHPRAGPPPANELPPTREPARSPVNNEWVVGRGTGEARRP